MTRLPSWDNSASVKARPGWRPGDEDVYRAMLLDWYSDWLRGQCGKCPWLAKRLGAVRARDELPRQRRIL